MTESKLAAMVAGLGLVDGSGEEPASAQASEAADPPSSRGRDFGAASEQEQQEQQGEATREEGEGEGEGEGAPESEREVEGEGEGEAELEGVSPEVQARIDRRIGKEVRRRKEAAEALEVERGRRAELEAEVSRLKGGQGPHAGQTGFADFGPLNGVEGREALQKAIDEAWQVKRWAEGNADGVTVSDGKGGERDLSAAEVRDIRQRAEETIFRWGPARERWLAERAQMDAEAVSLFPALKDPKSQFSVLHARVLAEAPWLAGLPARRLVAAVYAKGLLALRAEEAAARGKGGGKAGAGARKPTPQPGAPSGGAPPRPSRKEVAVETTRARAYKTGTEADVAAHLEALGV
jgi:hypothetical protein